MEDYSLQIQAFITKKYNVYMNALKNNERLYFEDVQIPILIINTYFNNQDLMLANTPAIANLFKKLYLVNEDFLEGHSKEEKKGLSKMYDFIENYNSDKIFFEIFFRLHQELFSESPYPEFAGKYREVNVMVTATDNFGSVDYHDIPNEMSKLRPLFNEIIALSKEEDMNVFEYIDAAVKLASHIIYIQPFMDGNKRTSRGLLNLLFKKVGLPPVYVDFDDKDAYLLALEKAENEGDYTYLNNFYYYRIGAAIVELGLIPKELRIEYSETEEAKKSL